MIGSPEPDYALIARVFADEATAAEREELEQWIRKSSDHDILVRRLHTVWAQTGVVIEGDAHHALAKIHSRIARRRSAPTRILLRSPYRWQPTAWAAAALVTLGLGSYTLRDRITWQRSATAEPLTQVATTSGQRATIQLSDGSTVTLSVSSRISYPRNFGGREREVQLEGEAYFDVKHDARVPFRVRTNHGVTEDVGTRFAVRAYRGEAASRVVVAEGKVAIAPHLVISAGDVALVTGTQSPVVEHHADVNRLMSWKDGTLEFVDLPLRDVVRDLERWYGESVKLNDPALGNRTITASFNDAPLSDVVAFIARVVDATVSNKAGSISLTPRINR
jgi:transmembrane sensor